MPSQIHLGDVGTDFNITILNKSGQAVDISSVSGPILFKFKKPDGTQIERVGSLAGDGTDGIVTYRTVSGDIDLYGNWKLQVFLEACSKELSSKILKFTVFNNLDCS